MKIICSTGAIGGAMIGRGGYMPDADSVREIYPLLQADGIELMLSRRWVTEEYDWPNLFAELLPQIATVHLQKGIGESYSSPDKATVQDGFAQLKKDLEGTSKLGVTKGVMHLWGWPDTCFDQTMDMLKESVKMADDYGVELLVETLPCREDTLLHRLERVVEVYPKCRFTADCRMLRHQNFDQEIFNTDWLWDEGRIAHIHVSDCFMGTDGIVAIHPILHPGDGIIDFPAFFSGLRRRGYDGTVTIESASYNGDTKTVELEKLNASLRYLRKLANE